MNTEKLITMKTAAILSAAGLLLLGPAIPAALAQTTPLALVLTPAGQAGTVPGTFQFTGTLSNTTSSEVFLNGDSPSFNGPGGLSAIGDSPFFDSAPLSLAPMGQAGDTYSGGFFDVTLPAGTAPDTYFGTFAITGGADGGATDTVASADFSVTVTGAASPAPEPSQAAGLGLGVLGLVGLALKARRRKSLV